MRLPCQKAISANKGDLVTATCRLKAGASHARVSLWSTVDGYPLAPHTQFSMIGLLIEGKPTMIPPMYARLTPDRRKVIWQIIAEEDLIFRVMQDVDTPDEPLAKVRIRASGQVKQGIRRFVQNISRFLRSYTKKGIRYNR